MISASYLEKIQENAKRAMKWPGIETLDGSDHYTAISGLARFIPRHIAQKLLTDAIQKHQEDNKHLSAFVKRVDECQLLCFYEASMEVVKLFRLIRVLDGEVNAVLTLHLK